MHAVAMIQLVSYDTALTVPISLYMCFTYKAILHLAAEIN